MNGRIATSDRTDETYDDLLARVFDERVVAWTEQAEIEQRFPRELLEYLGTAGVFAHKWQDRKIAELGPHLALAARLGALNSAGIGVGVSLHDSAISILRRFGRTDFLRDLADRAIRVEQVLCIAASEESGGSDLQQVRTVIAPHDGGYRVTGHKKFVSLSPIADHILVVGRAPGNGIDDDLGTVAVAVVPAAQAEIAAPYRKLGAGPLDTAAVAFDTWIPEEALVARAGTGLAVISWGLAHERYSVAGQIAAACASMLGVTLARMTHRSQFGARLYDHQALRLRIADLQARVDLLRYALAGVAAEGRITLRTAAAFKVCAATLGEEVASQCLHIFGGAGYLETETPVGRWWRDMKLARVGGGTDEVLWELVAAGMKPDHEGYARMSMNQAVRP